MKRVLLTLIIIAAFGTGALFANDVLVLGDRRIAPVSEVINKISETLHGKVTVYTHQCSPSELEKIVADEKSKVVAVVGVDFLTAALSLPKTIPIVYSLLIKPVTTDRQNVTGVYMETPLDTYYSLFRKYFPEIVKIGVIDNEGLSIVNLANYHSQSVKTIKAANSYDLLQSLEVNAADINAIILVPNKVFLAPTVFEQIYLYSFRYKKPVIGISEKHVRAGSLFAVVFNLPSVATQTGDMLKTVLETGTAANIPHSPPAAYDIYINMNTSRKMGIKIPQKLIDEAARVLE